MRKINIVQYFFFIILAGVTFSSCMTIKPASTKSPKRHYETFYTEQGTMYFIKPFTLKSKSNKESLTIDFTFTKTDITADSATVNFSIVASEVIKSIESLTIKNDQNQSKTGNLKLLFNEPEGKNFISRYSVEIPLSQIIDLFANENWVFEIETSSKPYNFHTEKDTKQNIGKLKGWIFDLF